MFYGRGAGMMPTGSAVVGDIMDVARNILHGSTGRVSCTCFEQRRVVPIEEIETRYYIRMTIADVPRALGTVAGALGDHDISIESVTHHHGGPGLQELVWTTYRAREAQVRAALDDLSGLPTVVSVDNWFRIEE